MQPERKSAKTVQVSGWVETSDLPVHRRLIKTESALGVKTHMPKESRPLATRWNQTCIVIFFLPKRGRQPAKQREVRQPRYSTKPIAHIRRQEDAAEAAAAFPKS